MLLASKALAFVLPRLRSLRTGVRIDRPRTGPPRPTFDDLVEGRPERRIDAPIDAERPSGARLRVVRGLHSGAHLALAQREYTIGSGRDCDIVLRDAGIMPLHARIVFESGDPLIVPAQPDSATPFARELIAREDLGAQRRSLRDRGGRGDLPPRSVTATREAVVRVRYDLGAVALSLEFEPRSAPAQRALGRQASRWTRRRMLIAGGATTLLLTSVLLGVVYSQAMSGRPDPNARAAGLTQRLAGLGFGDVRVEAQQSGELRVAGYVATAADKTRLADTLAREGMDRRQIAARVGDELVAQVRASLGADELRVTYAGGGRISVSGSTSDLALKERLRTLAIELRGAIDIEDRVAHVESKAERKPRNRSLPVKIVNVLPGEHGYFQTESGARYFEGSVMPDGAQVVKIDGKEIVFRLDERDIVYSLE